MDVTSADGVKYAHRYRGDPPAHVRGCGKTDWRSSVGRALQAMRRADIVVLVVDAEEGPTQQDFVLAERAATTEGCGLVLCVNKWDKIDKDSYSMNEYTKSLRSKLRVFEWASVVYTSALTGQRVQKVLATAAEASTHHRKRLTTATLNAVVQGRACGNRPRAEVDARARFTTPRRRRRDRPPLSFSSTIPSSSWTPTGGTWNDRCARTSDSRDRPCVSYGAVRAWEREPRVPKGDRDDVTRRGGGAARIRAEMKKTLSRSR